MKKTSMYLAMVSGDQEQVKEMLEDKRNKGVLNPEYEKKNIGRVIVATEKTYRKGGLLLSETLLVIAAAKAALAKIEEISTETNKLSRQKILLFTVGDSGHDLHKNMVEVLLRTNGFQAIDLGMIGCEEDVVEAVLTHHPVAIYLYFPNIDALLLSDRIVRELERAALLERLIVIGGGYPLCKKAVPDGLNGFADNVASALALFKGMISTGK